ncbi:MAG: EamA family transporter, partial [Cyanobacteria bacterium J083]
LMVIFYYRELNLANFKKLSLADLAAMTLVAIIDGVIVPTLFFMALSLTMVNNVVLIGRVEPPVSLILAVWLLQEKINLPVIIGSLLAFLGIIFTIVLQPDGFTTVNMAGLILNKGDLLALIAAMGLSVAITISKKSLQGISVGIFSCYKTCLGTIVFFLATLYFYGLQHFQDAFSPLLWQWMVFYGAVIVAGGQILWLLGLKKSSATEMTLISSFNPILGISFAYLLLGETPTRSQYIGASIILIGIAIAQWGNYRLNQRSQPKTKQLSLIKSQTSPFQGF